MQGVLFHPVFSFCLRIRVSFVFSSRTRVKFFFSTCKFCFHINWYIKFSHWATHSNIEKTPESTTLSVWGTFVDIEKKYPSNVFLAKKRGVDGRYFGALGQWMIPIYSAGCWIQFGTSSMSGDRWGVVESSQRERRLGRSWFVRQGWVQQPPAT